MRPTVALLLLLACLTGALAELPPSAYEAMQNKAPEYLKIEVLRVAVEPGETPTQQNVEMVALVTQVLRTESGVKPNDILNIRYPITEHPRGWTGPGSVPLLNEKDASVAYLQKADSGEFVPAAGRMSFSNF